MSALDVVCLWFGRVMFTLCVGCTRCLAAAASPTEPPKGADDDR